MQWPTYTVDFGGQLMRGWGYRSIRRDSTQGNAPTSWSYHVLSQAEHIICVQTASFVQSDDKQVPCQLLLKEN